MTPEAVERMIGHTSAAPSPPTDTPSAPEPLHGLSMLWESAAEERLRRIPITGVRATVMRKVEP